MIFFITKMCEKISRQHSYLQYCEYRKCSANTNQRDEDEARDTIPVPSCKTKQYKCYKCGKDVAEIHRKTSTRGRNPNP